MASTAINLTLADSGSTFQITDADIIKVYTDTLGAGVVYDVNGAIRKVLIVTETPSAVATLSNLLIDVTLPDGTTVYINSDRIFDVTTDTLGSLVEYDNEGAIRERLVFTETPAAIKAKRDAL